MVINCSNGGSYCDDMHVAKEIAGHFRHDRLALADLLISDTGHLSYVGNDYDFEFVFMGFVEGLGRAGDMLLGLATHPTSFGRSG